jgi:hypothetical protein
MERNEISIHETRAFRDFLKSKGRWITSKELAKEANIAERTARAFCLKFAKLGLVDLAEVFPAHKYRLSDKASKRNAAYFGRLEKACEIFFGHGADAPAAPGGKVSVLDAFKELYKAGGSDWDKIDDPEKFLREVTGE